MRVLDEVDDHERRRTAIHESGHALVALLIGALDFVSIEPSKSSLGRTVLLHRPVIDLGDHRAVEREVALHLAGCIAEIIYDSKPLPTGCTNEVWHAYQLAVEIGHGRRGFMKLAARTAKMLKAVWPTLLVLADELQRHGQLDRRAVHGLVRRELGLRVKGGL